MTPSPGNSTTPTASSPPSNASGNPTSTTQPDPYFSNQPPGRRYIEHAPRIPPRTSSPYHTIAKDRVQTAIINLRNYALANKTFEPHQLLTEAHNQLRIAQDQMQHDLDRDVFLQSAGRGANPVPRP